MFLGATNFVLVYFVAEGDLRRPYESEESHFYVGLLALLGSLVVVLLALDP